MSLLSRIIIYFLKLFLLNPWQQMLLTLKELQYQNFLLKIEFEYNDVVYHNHIQWLNRGKVLKKCFDLRQETEILITNKGIPVLKFKKS